MKLEDIKVGMKVKLLGKHGLYDNYNNVEDWFTLYLYKLSVQQIKKQGYAVVTNIIDDNIIYVSDNINGDKWGFLPSDLEPYERVEDGISEEKIKSIKEKTPKEWLLTPKAMFITRGSDEEYVVLGNNTAIGVDSGCEWDDDLENDYTDDLTWYNNLPDNDIMQITYNGEIVWKRKEYMTLTDAIKTGKKLKVKDWDDFVCPTNVMLLLSAKEDELINLFTDKVWEVEE